MQSQSIYGHLPNLKAGASVESNHSNTNVLLACGFVFGAVVATTFCSIFKSGITNWGNLAEWATGILTAGLIAMAWWQVRQQTLQQRQWATLQVCDRYDTDNRLCDAILLLRNLANGKETDKSSVEILQEITRLFNYFDAIAIGVDQGLYVDAIVNQHLRIIIDRRFAELEKAKNPILNEFRENFDMYYEALVKLRNRWLY